MKRSVFINLFASCFALLVVTVFGLMLRMQVGILLYVLTGAVMVAVLVLIARDCLYRLFDARHTLVWQYWVGILLMLGSLVLFLAASVANKIWIMNVLLLATVVVAIASVCWMRFCWLVSLEPIPVVENPKEGDEECAEETVAKYQEYLEQDQTVLSDEL